MFRFHSTVDYYSDFSAWVWGMSGLTQDGTSNLSREAKLSGADGDKQKEIVDFLGQADSK